MRATFDRFLSDLRHASVRVSDGNGYPEPGQARILFANGTKLQAEYWSLINDGKAGRSSFDRQQRYILPARMRLCRCCQPCSESRPHGSIRTFLHLLKHADLTQEVIDKLERAVEIGFGPARIPACCEEGELSADQLSLLRLAAARTLSPAVS
jgi:hypothetical protein